jgi:DNA-binding NarL/FixJ family response regulator
MKKSDLTLARFSNFAVLRVPNSLDTRTFVLYNESVNLFKNLLQRLGLADKHAPAVLRFDFELVQHIHALAERERRAPDEFANTLLTRALNERQLAEDGLADWQLLTPREQDVAALACLGYTSRQIAQRLVVSPETVKSHVRNILAKFGAPNRADLRRRLEQIDFSAWDT